MNRRWRHMQMRDAMEDTLHVYPPISALEIARAHDISRRFASDCWLSRFAQQRSLRWRPWKKAR